MPAIAEAGLPGYEMTARFGATVPAKASRIIIARLNAELVRALRPAQVQERFAGLGLQVVGSSPDDYQRITVLESERLGRLIKAAGIKPQ